MNPVTTPDSHRRLATSFDRRAGQYARLRPGYPEQAIEAALPSGRVRVLDVGAGTGKLTAALLRRGDEVIAVEPLPNMLAELHRSLPTAPAVLARAEQLPIADAAVDAVAAGQAFHWFDEGPALAEMARVLRPGGTLALLWNHDDESDPLVQLIEAEQDRAGRPSRGASGQGWTGGGTTRADPTPPFTGHPWFTEPQLTEVGWTRRLSVDDLVGLLNTYSYVIRSSDSVRSELDRRVRALVAARQQDAMVTMPAICQVWRSTRRTGSGS